MGIWVSLLFKRIWTATEQVVSYDSVLLYWFPLSETGSRPLSPHDSALHIRHCNSKQKFVIAISVSHQKKIWKIRKIRKINIFSFRGS